MTTAIYAFNDRSQVEMLLERGKTNLLISYYYLNQKKNMVEMLDYIHTERMKFNNPGYFMLDSGAYSAWKSGFKVKLHEFIAFIKKHHKYFTHVVCLDVIDNPVYSEVNHRVMLEELKDYNLEIIPVFHAGESFAVLDYMVNKGYSYIGISPNNNWREADKRTWLHKVYSRYDFDALNIKTHGFGYQSTDGLMQFPMTTADAITWKIAAGYGRVIDPINPSVRYSDRAIGFGDHIDSIPGGHSQFTKDTCELLGMTPDELRSMEGDGHKKRSRYNIEAIDNLIGREKIDMPYHLDLFADDTTSMGYCAEEFSVEKVEEIHQRVQVLGVAYEGDPL